MKNEDQPRFGVVPGKVAHRVLWDSVPKCIETVKSAYLAHGEGETINPNSFFLRFPEKPSARIIGLPAHLRGPGGLSGIKWIASYPENIESGLPRASAAILLNDPQTGYPFACVEGSIISAARTAGSAVLTAGYLTETPKRIETLAFVGCGLIARYVYRFFLEAGWEIGRLALFDLHRREAERFGSSSCRAELHERVDVFDDLGSAALAADTIVFTTVAPTPHVTDRGLFEHAPTVLHLSLRDLAPQIILDSFNVVDDVDHVLRAETSVHLAEQLSGNRSFIAGTIPELLKRELRVDRTAPRILSPFGLGVLDLAVARWVYEEAVARDEVVRVDNFFYDLDR